MENELPGDLPPSAGPDLELVLDRLIGHNLRREEIREVLLKLSESDREAFTSRLAELLRKTSALLTVSQRLADSLSLDVLLPRMVELISDFLEAERCTIFLYDREGDELYTKAGVGLQQNEIRFPSSQGIAGAVFKSGEAALIPDAYADPRFNPDIDRRTGFRTRNILCVPMRHRRDGVEQVVGVAQVLNKRRGQFSEEDLNLLDTLNSQAASAFVNALLHEEIQRARAEEVKLLEVTQAVSEELQLHPLLVKIMEAVALILDADRATLFMHDPGRRELWATVAGGDDEGHSEIRFPDHLGIAGHVFTSGETINIPDAYADARFNREVDRRTGYRTHNILCMPVINRRGERIAVTQVLNKRGGPFTGIDEKRLRAFSAQASIAMEHARLFDEVIQVKNYNESILESMSSGVLTLSAAGVIVKANGPALRLLRHERRAEEVLGRSAAEFFAGANAWVAEAADAVRATGKGSVAMDATLAVGGEAAGVSVNLSAVPLAEAKEQAPGCILMLEDITREKRLRSTMARYMPKEVADKLLEEGEAALGGKLQKASVLFTDIRGFTSISEKIGPQETVKLLNDYFGQMVDILFEHGGILDKYIGDAIMAVFGAPFAAPEDAENAVKAAVGMLRAMRRFNEQRFGAGREPIMMGVGINTDEVLSGNIGSLKRMDYTVIGDGVNLASRLESANKTYGTQLLVSELTVRDLREPHLLREVDRIRVKGKTRPVAVHEVLDHFGEGTPARDPAALESFRAGLEEYRSCNWQRARNAFAETLRLNPHDGLSRLYIERSSYFAANPPLEDWDGVWVMKEK